MKHSRAALIAGSAAMLGFFAFVATAEESDQKPDERPAHDLLQESIDQLAQQETIQTELEQRVEMFGKTLNVTGRYIKGAGDLQMRLDLNVQIPRYATDETGATSLLLVVDGARLTMHESVLGLSQDVTIDVQAVLNVLVQQKKENLRTLLLDVLGIGGLPQLLRGLDDTMDPEKWVRLTELEESFEGESGRRVYVLQGQWREELLQRRLPQPAAAAQEEATESDQEAERPIPPFFPTHVVLYLDRDTGLPHRMEYQRRDPKTKQVKTIVELQCRDAKFGEKVRPENFLAEIRPQTAIDLTDNWVTQLSSEAFLEQLEQAKQLPGSSPLRLIVDELMQPPSDAPPPAAAP